MPENWVHRGETAEPYEEVAVSAEDGEGSIDFAALFLALRLGKKKIFLTALVVFVVATVIAFSLPSHFTSTVSFIPPNLGGGNSMASVLAGQLSALSGSDLLSAGKTSGDLYAGILSSRSIEGELVQRFELMHVYRVKKESVAEKTLGSNTNVVVDLKSSIVTLSVTDHSPALAHDIANAYMDALRETNERLALNQSSERRLFFEQQLAKEKDDLEDAEVDLKKTEEQSGLIAPVGQTDSEIKTIAETQAQIAIRQVQLAGLRQSATDQNPDVIRLRSEISDLQGQLARLQKGGSNEPAMTIPAAKVPTLQLEYVRKEREVKYHEALFDMLSKQYEAARLDEARDSPVLQVLDAASYPDTESSPRRGLIMLGGLVLGLIAGCGLVLGRELLGILRESV